VKRRATLVLIFLLLSSSIGGQVPQPPSEATEDAAAAQETTPPKTPEGMPALTAADVGAYLDAMVPLQLEREDIAGATISVVKDGKLLFSKGYGYADVANKKPVSPETTLFRPGSVSKLFTWTAVMQLHEQGKLDLDLDVNSYLDFRIPDAFGKPITLKNILTHTPGFEEQIKDLFSVGSNPPQLGDYLKSHIPRRIYPPGTVPAYSNFATALAGYIVERVSGKSFNDYVDENIFRPLGMTHSTFAQPLPGNLAPDMSVGYRKGSGEANEFEVVNPFPAGSMSSTANDMARFMIAHLQNGELEGSRILRPETAQLMHSRLFALDDGANAMCHGFYEESRNGHRIIGHAGDTIYFHSDLHLVLDSGVGFFVSYNSAGKSEVSPRTMLWEAFLDRYFPHPPNLPQAVATAAQDAQAVSGSYMLSRRSEYSFLRTASLLGQFTVAPSEGGTIEVAQLTNPNGKPKRWRAVAPMTFAEEGGQDKLIFKPDQSGRMQLVLPYPFFVGQRVGLMDNGKILMPVIIGSLAIMLLTLLLWPVAWLVRRHYGHRLELDPRDWWLRLGVRIVFALILIFVLALIGMVVYGLSNLGIFSDRGNTWFRLIQVVGMIGAIGTAVVFYNAVMAWLGKRRIWGKLQATVFALACVGFLWFVFAGNLLKFANSY
jgi:CubicO group peptidase (beta-lactamase class C family)